MCDMLLTWLKSITGLVTGKIFDVTTIREIRGRMSAGSTRASGEDCTDTWGNVEIQYCNTHQS